MKTIRNRLILISFFLLLGKSIFDIYFFSAFFSIYNSSEAIGNFLFYTAVIGLIVTIVFNFLQRAFLFRMPVIFLFIIIFCVFAGVKLNQIFNFPESIYFIIGGLNIAVNLLIILLQKGIVSRLTNIQDKITEKAINIGNSSGLLISSFTLLYLYESIIGAIGNNWEIYTSATLILTSGVFIILLIKREKHINYSQDNLQSIKVGKRFYKLIFQKYFLSIFILMSMATCAMTLAYSFFIKTNIIKYSNQNELLILFSILILVYSIVALTYEFIFKDRLTYTLNMKMNLQLLTIVMLVFSLVFVSNSLVINIGTQDEFYFFVSIFAVLFIIFSQFTFMNIFYPAINRLYLPLKSNTPNDFYIKSSFYGLFIGIGVGSAIINYLLPGINMKHNGNHTLSIIGLVIFLYLTIRYFVYLNYKKALHSRLTREGRSEFQQETFTNTIINRLNKFKDSELIRIVNLVQLINPLEAKSILKKLSGSENTIAQRIGITGAIKYYLFYVYNNIKEISKSKYYASSPNRNKIDLLIQKFHEIDSKMQKSNYIDQLSISKKENERILSSLIVEHASVENQKEIIYRLINDNSETVAQYAINAAATINSPSIITSILNKLGTDKTANTAISVLSETDDQYIDLMNQAFNKTGQKEDIQIRIIQILGKIATEKSVEIIVQKLNHTNQNIVTEALNALSNCNIELPENKKYILMEELQDTCKHIVWNTSYILDLTKYKASNRLLEAMEAEIAENFTKLFSLLSLIYNPGSVGLIRKSLRSLKIEKITFALELATLVIKDELKPMIIPLLRPLSYEQRVKKMQSQFITESMDYENLLYDLIQQDTKWINGWTKTCALLELENLKSYSHNEILMANMINPDPMIAEISASIFKSASKKIFEKHIKSIKNKLVSTIGISSYNAITKKDNENWMPILKHEIINYLQSINEFQDISGEVLKHLTNNIKIETTEENNIIYNASNYEVQPFFLIIFKGSVELRINEKQVGIFSNNSLISSLDYYVDFPAKIEVITLSKTLYYKLDTYNLVNKLSLFDSIAFSIINNTDKEKNQQNVNFLMNQNKYKKQINMIQ